MGRRQATAAASGGGGRGRGADTIIPCAESLIGRLDQLDHRLRQLEEKQTRPDHTFLTATAAADVRSTNQCNSSLLSSSSASAAAAAALHQQVHLKGNLMDRLHLLETRIRQLSSELEKGNSSSDAAVAGLGSLTTRSTMTIQQKEEEEEEEKKKQNNNSALSSSSWDVAGAPWRAAGEIFHNGAPARELQLAHKSKTKAAKESKLEPAVDAMKTAMCSDDKRRTMERTRFYKRWFPVGC